MIYWDKGFHRIAFVLSILSFLVFTSIIVFDAIQNPSLYFKEKIDPNKVIWDSHDIKPWIKYLRQNDVCMIDINAFRKGFSGDPLANFNPEERKNMEKILNTYENPGQAAKKHIIAQYLSLCIGIPPKVVLDNFQTAIDAYLREDNISIDKAYKAIAEIINTIPKYEESVKAKDTFHNALTDTAINAIIILLLFTALPWLILWLFKYIIIPIFIYIKNGFTKPPQGAK